MHYLADLGTAEIAAELGIPEGTVKSRLARGRNDAGPGPENRGGDHLVFFGDEVRMLEGAATVTSSDEGRTWTQVSTWR